MRGGKSKIMPKVFQINVTANWGSTGKIAEQIGSCAIQHGWDSYLAYGRMSNPSKNSLIKIGNQLYVYEHYIENKLFDNEGLASRYATVKLINKIKEILDDEYISQGVLSECIHLLEYFGTESKYLKIRKICADIIIKIFPL